MAKNPTIKRSLGKAAGYAVPLIVSVGLCYMLFTNIDFGEMTEIVSSQCRP